MENKVLDLKHELTSNNLVDVIEWLKEGAYVIIHNAFRSGRYFHYQCGTKESELNDLRVIYLDVKSLPGLLDDGEWEYYIKQEKDCLECNCALKERLSNPNDLTHSVHLQLGF